MDKPKISIIVPCYCVEKYLDQCVDTLVKQTIKDIEIILINDASPDNVGEICNKWANVDKRIRVIHKEINEGLGLTRNTGLSVAKGEYVAFVDSDDYVDSRMYEILYAEAQSKKLDACFCDYRYDTGDGIKDSREIKETKDWLTEGAVRTFLLDMIAPEPEYPSDVKHLVSVWRAIYKRSVIEDYHVRFESERENGSEDIPFNMDFLSRAQRVGYVPFPGYYYRYNPLSLSRNYTHAKFHLYEHLFDEVRERLTALFPESQYKLHYQRFVFYFFRNIIKYESILNIKGERMKNILIRCGDLRMREIYNSYPYWRLPLKQRVFFVCMKHNVVHALYAMCLLENKIRKNV